MFNFPGTRLYVGDINDTQNLDEGSWAVVHATQTVHYKFFGWNRTNNKPNRNHPNYISYEKDNHFSLNWVDGASYLYDWSGPATFIRVLDFIDKWIPERKILVHCDQGLSRSPILCLLFLAKRKASIPNISYIDAKNEFIKIYPAFNPGGIGDYVNTNWDKIK